MPLLVCVPLDSSFISTQFLVLNLDGWFDALFNKVSILDILLLYCYTNLNPSIICCRSFGDMYHFFGTSFWLALPTSFRLALSTSISLLELLFFPVLFVETLVILSAILLPIKLPVASAVFSIALFDAVFIASDVNFLALLRSF